jgi:hypothetical protein
MVQFEGRQPNYVQEPSINRVPPHLSNVMVQALIPLLVFGSDQSENQRFSVGKTGGGSGTCGAFFQKVVIRGCI